MKELKEYRIPFSGLGLGKHQFQFDIGRGFFDCYDYSIVEDGALKADVVLDKQAGMLVVYVNITGTIKLACDLCLNEFDQNTDITEQLVVKFQDADLDDITDEIMVLGKNDHEFSIADFLYEHITLSVPLYIRCEAQEGQRCDEEMVRVLRDLSPKPTEEKLDDPRWAALKNITRNN